MKHVDMRKLAPAAQEERRRQVIHGDSVLGKVSKDTRMLCGLMAAT
jgi:hypothetical protein